ncbi:MAG: thioredoxin domain-containing protein [Desulfobacterales bacterium]
MTSRRRQIICLILIALGMIVSGYLLARTFTLMSGQAPGAVDVCSKVFGTGCDKTLLSQTSWNLGLPLAGWGVVYFAALACLIVMAMLLGEAFATEATVGAFLLGAAGACISIALSIILFTGRAPFCPLCLVVHAINLTLLPALWWLTGRNTAELFQELRVGIKYLWGGQVKDPREARWKVVGFLTVMLVAIVMYQWVLVQAEIRKASDKGFEEIAAVYASTPKREVPVSENDPRLGPDDAPAILVVFASFQCPGCRTFALNIAPRLASRFEDGLAVIFKNFPLGKDCNPELQVDMQPWACEAAWTAEAARKQGKFWPFHDAIFALGLNGGEETIMQIARNIGLDMERFETDRRDQSTLAKVKADVALGRRLGIDGTPTVFLNGRQLRVVSIPELAFLIGREIAK